MAFANNTPGRSRHIAMIANLHDDSLLSDSVWDGRRFKWSDLVDQFQRRARYLPSTALDGVYDLPNERGVLIEVGTTRLPATRHDAAEVLWRLWGVDAADGFSHNIDDARGNMEAGACWILLALTK